MNSRPINELLSEIEKFKTNLQLSAAQDRTVNMIKFASIYDRLREMVSLHEAKRDFPISDKTFIKLNECQKRLVDARLKYKEDYAVYEMKKAEYVRDIDRINADILKFQGDSAINLLDHAIEIEFFQGEIHNQIERIDRSLTMQNCCFRVFSCCGSKTLIEQQERVERLEAEYSRLGSKDPNTVINILREKLNEQLEKKYAEQAEWMKQRPTENFIQQCEQELENLNVEVNAARFNYYRQIQIQTMLQLVRMRAFLDRGVAKLEKEKRTAEHKSNLSLAKFYNGLIKLVKDFISFFDRLSDKFVCRVSDDDTIEIGYSEYVRRFDGLKDAANRRDEALQVEIINGERSDHAFAGIKEIFAEHYPEEKPIEIPVPIPALGM